MRNPPVHKGLALLSACQEDPCLAPRACPSRRLPPSALPSLTAKGSDLVSFHKLSNFQLFNDLDEEAPRRQTELLEQLAELLPTRL